VTDAKDIKQAELLDHDPQVEREIQEVIRAGRRLVAGAVATTVDRIDRVAGRQPACDLIPDFADESRAVDEQRRRLGGRGLAPSRNRHAGAGLFDPYAMSLGHLGIMAGLMR